MAHQLAEAAEKRQAPERTGDHTYSIIDRATGAERRQAAAEAIGITEQLRAINSAALAVLRDARVSR